MTDAKVIADSISGDGYRVTTMEVTFHRFVLAEFNTHRVFSRNSASSRAIPFAKQVERVTNDPATPVSFPAEQRGMQGGDEVEPRETVELAWKMAAKEAVLNARFLASMGVHKSVVNRILEPFMWHTVIVTSTEWDNFFEQRCSPLAQPEIRVAAEMMQEAYNNSVPAPLDFGQWHMPYIDDEDYRDAKDYLWKGESDYDGFVTDKRVAELLRQVSAARCARVSYLTHDGVRSIEKDLELYKRLVTADPPHSSPLEHVCTPASYSEVAAGEVLGNLVGWYQLRHNTDNPKYMR